MSETNHWKYFYEIYEAMPRQGPGNRESTERALHLLPPLTHSKRILDIGCGTGSQTIDIARATSAQIIAIDNHAPFVTQLNKKASELGLSNQITAEFGDMNDLQFPDGSFDVIWSEGAVYIIGFTKGLTSWHRLLAPGGFMVISEFCWFRDNPPDELKDFLTDDGCSDFGDVDARRKAITACGYRLLGDFALPATCWWDNYYVPLADCLERFCITHASNPEALDVLARSQYEIDLYRKYPEYFGYEFFIMTPE